MLVHVLKYIFALFILFLPVALNFGFFYRCVSNNKTTVSNDQTKSRPRPDQKQTVPLDDASIDSVLTYYLFIWFKSSFEIHLKSNDINDWTFDAVKEEFKHF